MASLKRDFHILKKAKEAADSIDKFDFYKKEKKIISDLVYRMWGDSLELTKII